MYYFVEIACVAAEVWMSHLVLSSLIQRKRQPLWVLLLVYALVGGILLLLSFMENMAFVRLGASLLLVWLMAFAVFRAKFLRGLFAAMIMCVVVALADVLTSLIYLAFQFDTSALMEQGNVRLLYLISGHIIMFGMVLGIYTLGQRKKSQASLKYLTPVSPCWAVSLLFCILLAYDVFIQRHDVPSGYLLVLLGLLYTNFVVIYYINRLSVREEERREQAIAEQHYAMQQEYYEQFRTQQEETRALWHDISKFLKAAQLEPETISQMQQILEQISPVVDVDNRVVSVILNEYVQNAKVADISFNMDVQVPHELFITAVDLYILLGNTLDNAIEACADLPKDKRHICLKLKVHNDILFYQIENAVSSEYGKRIRGKNHGYGLKNVRRCVEKYNGTLEIQKEPEYFRIVTHLNRF